MKTVIGFGDSKAQKKWSGSLFIDTMKKSYFDRKFVGESDNHVIQRLTDLESDSGDTITFDLSVQLRNKPTSGDNRLEGKEEQLKFFSDAVYIDQLRHGVSAGGKMTRKRTVHNIRKIARDRLSDYWSGYMDELHFIYLSGARGINEDFIEDVTYAGHAGNAIQAPDTGHLLYGGDATSKATIDTGDKMTRTVIEKAVTKSIMLRATDKTKVSVLPVMINGEAHFVCVMSPFQEHDMRTDTGATGWLEIQKAAAAAEGKNNPIFKGGLGMINNVVLHSHSSAIRFSDYGAGSVKAARALFMGRQAGVVAYGSSSGLRFSWTEEVADHGNEPKVAAGVILGVKKTRFNSADFGIISIDTAAADPNA
jgi:N4-gp56 family major capsid protein